MCGICVVTGAPKRTWIAVKTGTEKIDRRKAYKTVCIFTLVYIYSACDAGWLTIGDIGKYGLLAPGFGFRNSFEFVPVAGKQMSE